MPENRETSNEVMSRSFEALGLKSGATIEMVVNSLAAKSQDYRAGKISLVDFEKAKEAFRVFAAFFKADEATLAKLLASDPEYLYLKQELYASQDTKGGRIDRTA